VPEEEHDRVEALEGALRVLVVHVHARGPAVMHVAHRDAALVHLLRLGAEFDDRVVWVGEHELQVAADLLLPARRLGPVVEACGFFLGDRRGSARGESSQKQDCGKQGAHRLFSVW
jgi:hypothetical protein